MPYKNKKDLYKNQVQRWIKRKKEVINYLGGSCKICGYNKYYGALHIHHINPKLKTANWTKMRLWSWGKIYEELKNCELVCSNCHAEIHSKLKFI